MDLKARLEALEQRMRPRVREVPPFEVYGENELGETELLFRVTFENGRVESWKAGEEESDAA